MMRRCAAQCLQVGAAVPLELGGDVCAVGVVRRLVARDGRLVCEVVVLRGRMSMAEAVYGAECRNRARWN